MKVFVVTGEFVQSRNGEVAWVVGVAQDEATARHLAEDDACSTFDPDEEKVVIGGEVFTRGEEDIEDENEDVDARLDEWTVWYEWNEHEVEHIRDEEHPGR